MLPEERKDNLGLGRSPGESSEALLPRLGSPVYWEEDRSEEWVQVIWLRVIAPQYSLGGMGVKQQKLGWPVVLRPSLRLKEPVTALRQGRRQLICMLNIWK